MKNKDFWLFFILALFTHLIFIFKSDLANDAYTSLLGDSWLIHNLAKSYAETGEMTYGGEYTLYQFPVYPFIISCFYKVFGTDPRYVLFFQIFLSSIFIPLFVIWSKPLLKNWRYLLGILLCFDLHQVLYSSCLLTEIWVMSLWCLGLYFYSRFKNEHHMKWWILAITTFTLTSNIKPLSMFLTPFLCVGLGAIDSMNFKRNFYLVSSGILIFVLGMSPLLYRNYLISGQFPLLTTNSALAFWYYNIPYARSGLENRDLEDLRIEHVELIRQKLLEQGKDIPPVPREQALNRHEHRRALGLDEFEYAVIANQLNREYLKKNFFSYAKLHILSGFNIFAISNISWLKLAFNEYDAVSFSQVNLEVLSGWWKSSDSRFWLFAARIYEISFTFTCVIFAMIGLLLLLIKKRFDHLHWAFVLIICYVICITGVNVWGRFRFLFMPILIFLGVQGAKLIYQEWIHYRTKKVLQV